MKGLIKLKEEAHNRVLNYRTIENIILRPRFSRLWMDSTAEEKKVVVTFVEAGDRKRLQKWMLDHPSLDLGEKSLSQILR